jgi:hypothetical protein
MYVIETRSNFPSSIDSSTCTLGWTRTCESARKPRRERTTFPLPLLPKSKQCPPIAQLRTRTLSLARMGTSMREVNEAGQASRRHDDVVRTEVPVLHAVCVQEGEGDVEGDAVGYTRK